MSCWNLEEYRLVKDAKLLQPLLNHGLPNTKIYNFIPFYLSIKKYVESPRPTVAIRSKLICNKNDPILSKLKIRCIHQNLLIYVVHLFFLEQYPIYNFEDARIISKILKNV